jgi:hypothetical protein
MRYGDKVLVRASAGDMLSNFAIQKYEGRLSIYEQRNSFQSGAQTFFNVNTKYFSIDADSLYYFNLENLRRHIHDSPASEKHLRIAYTKKWIAAGIRVASIIPFMVGIRKAQDEQTQRYLIPFGIGALMITVPLFTIRPSVRKDMQKAIEEYNTKI